MDMNINTEITGYIKSNLAKFYLNVLCLKGIIINILGLGFHH